jgi:hypothetical protein
MGLVEWLKVKALSSNPSTAIKKERKKRKRKFGRGCSLNYLEEIKSSCLDLYTINSWVFVVLGTVMYAHDKNKIK